MLIKREILEKIKSGEITLQFRRWRRRTVKPGGTLKTTVGVLSIGEIKPISADDVTDADAKAAGLGDREGFLRWLETMKPGELDRIEVSYLGADPRDVLAMQADLSESELASVAAKLDTIDARAADGAWTQQVMTLISEGPGRLAELLAADMKMEKQAFKTRVRKLKEMGLTESLEVGYRLSPRGETVLNHRRRTGD